MPNLPTAAEIAELIEFCQGELSNSEAGGVDDDYIASARSALAIAERLPALVAEIERVGAECAMRGKEVMKVYAERDRLSYKLYASMDGSARHGYVEECRRLTADLARLTKERDDANAALVMASNDRDAAESALARLSRENAAMREALERIKARDWHRYGQNSEDGGESPGQYAEIAMSALAQLDAPPAEETIEDLAAANAILDAPPSGEGCNRLMGAKMPWGAHGEAVHVIQAPLSEDGFALAAARKTIAEAVEIIDWLVGMTKDSEGIIGYHMNGSVAAWGEFEEVGAARAFVEAHGKKEG